MTRFLAEPPFFELMKPLLDALIEKTRYHSKQACRQIERPLWTIQKSWRVSPQTFLDANAPIFSKLTEAEKVTREATIRPGPK
jgi:hypothetical protein